MKKYLFKIVNVFAESHFGGNPLAVFPHADGLNDEEMQLIARQFNLSETVFLHSPTDPSAVKKLRIFTPDYELPFAGHPTIGAAFVLHQMLGLTDYQLATEAGLVQLQHQADNMTFSLNNGVQFEEIHDNIAYAKMIGVKPEEIVKMAWVNTGSKQCLIQLANKQAVENCQISATDFFQLLPRGIALYLWFAENNVATVRLFFSANGAICEDPGTGSAAANLGGWHIAQGSIPLAWQIEQGDQIGRPNRLSLAVDPQGVIYVGAKAIEVGQGEFFLP